MATGRGVNVGVGNISISPVLAPGFGALLQRQLAGINTNIQLNPQINQQGLRNLNGQLGQTSGAATRLRTVFAGAFAALQARALQQHLSALSGISNKITEIASAATSAGSALGPLLGLVGGLGAGFAVAGAGIGAFAALAKPQITSVTTATQAVTKAQAAYSTAIATGDSAGAQKALQDRAAALATLTPAQQTATQATLTLEDAFKKQSDALAPVTLGLYTSGVKTLTGLLPALAPIAQAAGSALQGIFGQAQAGLGKALGPGGGLGQFLNVVKTQIGPVLQSLSGILVNVGRTLSNVFQAAVPAIQPALGVIKDLTGELSKASSGGGLASFFKQIVPLLQPLRAAITSIASALGSFIQAALPLAGPVLNAVKGIADALGNLFNSQFFKAFVANLASIITQITPLFNQLVGPLGQIISHITGQFAQLLPTLIPVIVQFANVFSNVLVGLSPLLPLFAQLIGILVNFLPILYPIIQALRAALAPVLQAVGQALIAIQPAVNAVINAFLPLLPLLGQLLASLVPIIAQLINGFAPVLVAVLNAIKPLIPIVTKIATLIAGYFAQALTIIFKAITPLLPVLSTLAGQLLNALLQVFKAIEPILLMVIKQFVSLLPALLPLVQAVVKLVLALLPLVPVLLKLVNLLLPLLIGILKLIAPIVTGLADAFVWVVKVVVSAVTWILNTVISLWHGLTVFFKNIGHDIGAIWDGFWNAIKTAVVVAWAAISDFFTKTIGPAFSKIWSGLVSGAKAVWDGIKAVFANPVIAVFKVVGGLAHIVDDVTDAIGLGKPLGSIEKSAADTKFLKFSTGGVVPGYGGGDRHPALLEGGEVVVRKEAARAMGGPRAVHSSLNQNFGGPVPAKKPGITPFDFGTGKQGHFGTFNPFSAVFDAGKWVLDKASHLLRAGAADAINASYQALLKPVLSVIGNGLGAKSAVGAVNFGEKKVIDWIRGKEGSDLVGTFIQYAGGSNTIGLIEQLAQTLGVPGLPVTSTFRANAGYHGLYEAVDFSNGPGYGPGSQTPGELAFNLAWAHKYGPSLAELIHAQPGAINIKDGRVVDGPSFYGPATMLDHWNHVHVAISPASIARGNQLTQSVGSQFGSAAISGGEFAGSPQAIAQQLLPLFGWGADQFGPLNNLWNRESSWNVHATNPQSGAYGIPQSLPASKMASAGPNWRDDAATQERWGLGYIKDVYGSPAGAWAHSVATGWYGKGGVARGWSVVGDRGPELIHANSSSRVLSNSDSIAALIRPTAALTAALISGTSGGGSRRPGLFDGANVSIGDNVDMDLALAKHDFAQRQGDL